MRSKKARETALTGMLFALAIAFSYLESLVSPLLGLMPAIKLGLSNIVVMYALLFLRTRTAVLLVVLKALFAFLTRGATAGFLSLCGGALSLAVCWCCSICRSAAISSVPALRWRTTLASWPGRRLSCPAEWLWPMRPFCWPPGCLWAGSAVRWRKHCLQPYRAQQESSARAVLSKNKILS